MSPLHARRPSHHTPGIVGLDVGDTLGEAEGDTLGNLDGEAEGDTLGENEGVEVGDTLGYLDGFADGIGLSDGAPVGA